LEIAVVFGIMMEYSYDWVIVVYCWAAWFVFS